MLQDDLIATLKQQIAGLDQHTKSLMKMTLYRISRNANATVSHSFNEKHLLLTGTLGSKTSDRSWPSLLQYE